VCIYIRYFIYMVLANPKGEKTVVNV